MDAGSADPPSETGRCNTTDSLTEIPGDSHSEPYISRMDESADSVDSAHDDTRKKLNE